MPIIPGANYDFGKVFADVVMRNQSMQNERAMNAERLALERARLDQQAQESEDRRIDARESRAQQWAMQDAQQTAQWLIAKGGWDHASAQRAAQEKFQENMAKVQFSNQLLMEDTRNKREDARFDKQFGYTKERDTVLDQRYAGEQKFKEGRAKVEDTRFEDQLKFTKERAGLEDQREREKATRDFFRNMSDEKFKQQEINLRGQQLEAEKNRWDTEDKRRTDDRDANIRIKATEAAMDAVKYARQANPMLSEEAANKILNDTFDFTIGAMQAVQAGGKPKVQPVGPQSRADVQKGLKERRTARDADAAAFADAVLSDNEGAPMWGKTGYKLMRSFDPVVDLMQTPLTWLGLPRSSQKIDEFVRPAQRITLAQQGFSNEAITQMERAYSQQRGLGWYRP